MEQTDNIFTGQCREWTRNLRSIPPFTHELLKQYLITDTLGKQGKPPNAHKHKKYGYQLFKEKMVTKLQVKPDILKGTERFFLVKCNVHASMKKVQYTVYVHFHQDTGKVSTASCSCVAGQGGLCKHVAALLYQILDFIQLELTEVPDDLTCTQLLQQWHVPASEDLKTAVLFDNIKFSKATSTRKCYNTNNTNNPAPAFARNVTDTDIKKLKDGLKTVGTCNYFENLLESNNCQPYDYNEFLAELPSKKKFTEAQQSAGQLFNVEIRDSILNGITHPNFAEVCRHIPCPQHVPFVEEKLLKTKDQIINIECNTRGQSDNNLWFEERRLRLTASNFGLVLKRRESIFPKSILTKQFTSVNSKTKTPKPCLWGQSNEQNSITKYLEKCNHDGQCIKACVQCGLVVNAEAPWLGGSPDCFLHDPSEEKPYGIGEVKCPFSKKDMTIEDACSDSSFFMLPANDENPTPTLKRNHNYYYQLQGLMATCNVEWADFIVYTMEEVFSERIYFENELWNKNMLPKLTSFYFSFIYPELLKV